MDKIQKHIVLSAGGTGGHVMPAQALAMDLLSRGFKVSLMTDHRGMKYAPLFDGVDVLEVRAGTLGAGLMDKIKGLVKLGIGLVQARSVLGRLEPDVVVGFGGYPSVPGVWAAQNLKIPTILHEQNAIIGKANALLAGKAERIASSMAELQGVDAVERVRTIFTGNPVRADIANLYTRPFPALQEDGPLRILVMGGSLGAQVFSDILPGAFARLSSAHRERLHIVQQCREEYIDDTRQKYKEAGVHAELMPFVEDVPEQLDKAHLVIARSGASTVAEVTTAGRPAIFVPYPHHKDHQQKMNADVVADAGGAWVMAQSGFTKDAVLARIETFLQNPSVLFKAAENARSCGRPDAARKLGNLVTAIMSGWNDE